MNKKELLALAKKYILLSYYSSRRRHTSLQGDWSSDVCSSDLPPRLTSAKGIGTDVPASVTTESTIKNPRIHAFDGSRSEERRVGKESRSLWATFLKIEKNGIVISKYNNFSTE